MLQDDAAPVMNLTLFIQHIASHISHFAIQAVYKSNMDMLGCLLWTVYKQMHFDTEKISVCQT